MHADLVAPSGLYISTDQYLVGVLSLWAMRAKGKNGQDIHVAYRGMIVTPNRRCHASAGADLGHARRGAAPTRRAR